MSEAIGILCGVAIAAFVAWLVFRENRSHDE